MEVEHVIFFKADVGAEVLTDDALPRWEEGLIKQLLKLLGQIVVLELG